MNLHLFVRYFTPVTGITHCSWKLVYLSLVHKDLQLLPKLKEKTLNWLLKQRCHWTRVNWTEWQQCITSIILTLEDHVNFTSRGILHLCVMCFPTNYMIYCKELSHVSFIVTGYDISILLICHAYWWFYTIKSTHLSTSASVYFPSCHFCADDFVTVPINVPSWDASINVSLSCYRKKSSACSVTDSLDWTWTFF